MITAEGKGDKHMAEGLNWFIFECNIPDLLKWFIIAAFCFASVLIPGGIYLKILKHNQR